MLPGERRRLAALDVEAWNFVQEACEQRLILPEDNGCEEMPGAG